MATIMTLAEATAQMAALNLTGLYLGLGTGQTSTGLTGEFDGGDYAREAVGDVSKSGPAATNDADVVLGPFSASLGTATHWGLFNAASGGTCRFVGSLPEATDLVEGEPATVPAGSLDLFYPVAP